MPEDIRTSLLNEIHSMPALDAHTHLDARHLAARGLHDVLMYHMMVSELYSAGCPDGLRLSENPGEEEISGRIERALPFLPQVQNTSTWAICRGILKDLYGWDELPTLANWQELHGIIQERSADAAWPREILKKANVRRLSTEWWRRGDGSADDVLCYALEWAFFARTQWGKYDTALLELEVTWDKSESSAPLPVTLSEMPAVTRPIRSVQDAKDAMAHYISLIPFDRVSALPQGLSTDITYRPVSDEEMQQALNRRENAGSAERDIYSSYLLNLFLSYTVPRFKGGVVQFSMGAEPLPYESGSKLSGNTLFEMAAIADRYRALNFQIFLASAHQNQALCTLVRELPNLYAIGYWWHSFYPAFIAQTMKERLDMIPINKHLGYFTDAYCLDWAYGKGRLIRETMADVMAKRVASGRYSRKQALDFCQAMLYGNASITLKMK